LVENGNQDNLFSFVNKWKPDLKTDNQKNTPMIRAIMKNSKEMVDVFIKEYGNSFILDDLDIFLDVSIQNMSYKCFDLLFSYFYQGGDVLEYLLRKGDFYSFNIYFVKKLPLVSQEQLTAYMDLSIELKKGQIIQLLLNYVASLTRKQIQKIISINGLSVFDDIFRKTNSVEYSNANTGFISYIIEQNMSESNCLFLLKYLNETKFRQINEIISQMIIQKNYQGLEFLFDHGLPGFIENRYSIVHDALTNKDFALLSLALNHNIDPNSSFNGQLPIRIAIESDSSTSLIHSLNDRAAFRDLETVSSTKVFEKQFLFGLELVKHGAVVPFSMALSFVEKFDILGLLFCLLLGGYNDIEMRKLHSVASGKTQLMHQFVGIFIDGDALKTQIGLFSKYPFVQLPLLHLSMKYSTPKIVNRMILKGFDIDSIDSFGLRPIDYGIASNMYSNIQILLQHSVSVVPNDPDFPTLHHSMSSVKYEGNESPQYSSDVLSEFIQYLQKSGQSINQSDSNGLTPIVIASLRGNLYVVDALVKNGASNDHLDDDITVINLLASIYQKYSNLVSSLPSLMIKSNISIFEHVKSILCSLCTNLSTFKYIFRNGDNLLHFSCKNNMQFLLEALLKQDFDINELNASFETPIHIATRMKNIRMTSILIKHGCHLNTRDDFNRTPLITSLQSGNNPCSYLLYSNGASPNVFDFSFRTPLHYSCINKNIVFTLLLLSHPNLINFPDKKGRTPLYYASKNFDYLSFTHMLNEGADRFIFDLKGRSCSHVIAKYSNFELYPFIFDSFPRGFFDINRITPFHLAAKNGNVELFKNYNINANVFEYQDIHGNNCLHWAVMHHQVRIVEFLINYSFKDDFFNQMGETPLIIAISKRDHEIIKIFKQNGYVLPKISSPNVFRRTLMEARYEDALSLMADGFKISNNYSRKLLMFNAAKQNRIDIVGFLLTNNYQRDFSIDYLSALWISNIKGYNSIESLLLSYHADYSIEDLLIKLIPSTSLNSQFESQKEHVYNTLRNYERKSIERSIGLNELSDFETLFQRILCEDDTSLIENLIQNGLYPDYRLQNGNTLLIESIERKAFSCFKTLLQMGSNPNKINLINMMYPLKYAVLNNKNDYLHLLVLSGASFQIKESNGDSILHFAAEYSSLEVVTTLIKYGANPKSLNPFD